MGLQQGWVAGTGPFFVDGQPEPEIPPEIWAVVVLGQYVRPIPGGGEFDIEVSYFEVTQPEAPGAPEAAPNLFLDDRHIRPSVGSDWDAQVSFWEATQPQAPPAPDGVASFGLDDQFARPTLGGEFDSWVSWWEVNQPAPGAPPDGVANFGLEDRIHRPYIPAESAFWWEKPAEVQTVPLGAWFPLPDELVRPVSQGNGESWVSFFEVTQPPPTAPELSWQGLRDELIRPVPRGESEMWWYPFVPPAGPVDVFLTEGDASMVTGLEGDPSSAASIEGDAGVVTGIEG